jgi:hypothetical protein
VEDLRGYQEGILIESTEISKSCQKRRKREATTGGVWIPLRLGADWLWSWCSAISFLSLSTQLKFIIHKSKLRLLLLLPLPSHNLLGDEHHSRQRSSLSQNEEEVIFLLRNYGKGYILYIPNYGDFTTEAALTVVTADMGGDVSKIFPIYISLCLGLFCGTYTVYRFWNNIILTFP